jgi:hypothetical protein
LQPEIGDILSKLAQALASWVRGEMAREILSLSGTSRECRAVFRGPPPKTLHQVFEALAGDGRLLTATTSTGVEISYPVILQVEKMPDGARPAQADHSGPCLFHGLASIRNAPNCGAFLTLVPPGGQASDTHESTRKAFGISPAASEGGAPISAWWNDPFIQEMVRKGLGAGDPAQIDEATKLVHEAVVSADAADQHSVERMGAWRILERLWELNDSGKGLDTRVSLATGFPPSQDGRLNASSKLSVLESLADKFERSNLGAGIAELKERAIDDGERGHLDAFLDHMRRRCSVLTALKRSMPYFYAPDTIAPPPGWWEALSLQRWEVLLDDDTVDSPKDELEIACTNQLFPSAKGFVHVVRDTARLRVLLSEGCEVQQVLVTREAGGKSGRREWTLACDTELEFEDDSITSHKAPVKYTAEAVGGGAKKATLKLMSIASWEAGLIVWSRAATKGKVPKANKQGAIETTLEMSGAGRHYLDVYVRPGVDIVSTEALGSNEDGDVDASSPTKVGQISDNEFGMEVEANGERFYELVIARPEVPRHEKFRVNLVADEATPEECRSYFEFHLARNSRKSGERLPQVVHANGQARSSQLQGWMLADACIAKSFYPFVIAPDYAATWQRREWSSPEDTIFSSARFLNDPRPCIEDMQPPEAFVNARTAIAAKIRGSDNDLIESANLGEWLATDKDFASHVDAYVRSYLDWLSSAPREACWCDVGLVVGVESDKETLQQEPDAILVSPLHPIRLAWQCLAQRAMFLAAKKMPCPAASIMDPDCVPDTIMLPLRNAAGGTSEAIYFSVECSSDYWSILWNTNRLDRLAKLGASAPLDRELGLLVGGISSGFSASQVHRAMDDVCEMLVAKPIIGVMVSSAAGQNNACNEGILSWGRKHLGSDAGAGRNDSFIGASEIHIFDERPDESRPEDAEISNLAEDTGNAVQWYSGTESSDAPDLAIIAQLETSNASAVHTKLASPLGTGGLVRARIREQQMAGSGQFLCESRMASPARVAGDGIADNTAKAIAALENIASQRMGYVFAPSINMVKKALDKAEFAAVSSSAVDPACFLGNWLEGTYLWDYELPSYSGRAGDSNGYYLLSQIKKLDIETLKIVLQRLPGCSDLTEEQLKAIVQEVARRGIPTVRGLSAGDSGAAGDLGLFVATRLLQDAFRTSGNAGGLLMPWIPNANGQHQIALVVPVDPFQRYLEDLGKAIKKTSMHRPDLLVVGLTIGDSLVKCRLTPVEVKNRSGGESMSANARLDAIGQAKSLSSLLLSLRETFAEDDGMLLWRLAYQNLLSAMIGYGFRVYSQHIAESGGSSEWSRLHSRVMESIFSLEVDVEIDMRGRLIVIDGSNASCSCDTDADGFNETIQLTQEVAGLIARGDTDELYQLMKSQLADWELLPLPTSASDSAELATGKVPSVAEVEPTGDGPYAVPSTANQSQEQSPSSAVSSVVPQQPVQEEKAEAPPEPRQAAQDEEPVQTGLNLRVGETIDAFQTHVRYLNLGHTALNQLNMGVVGDLGTGKTQLLKSLVYQIATGVVGNRGIQPNVLIFDYKRDYSADDFVQAVGARVIRPQHLPLNLFDLSQSSQAVNPWIDRFKFFSDVIDKIYSGIGPVQRDGLKNAIKDAYRSAPAGSYPTIYDVHGNYLAGLKGKADSLSSILGDIVDMELFAQDPADILSAGGFLKGVVVISLSDLGQDDRTKNMLVAIMLNVFYEHMLKIPKRPFLGANGDMRVVDSMLLVDEADNIMKYEFDVLRRILLQGREFGVGVILASQYLSHFKTGAMDYREPLLTWFLHKVPNLRPPELGALGLTDTSALQQITERIKTLRLHECLYKTHDVQGEFIKGSPFYLREKWSR